MTVHLIGMQVNCHRFPEGFIFVNPEPEAGVLLPQVAPGFERLAKHLPGLAVYHLADRPIYAIHANWKNVGDNLLECLSCRPTHKAFIAFVESVQRGMHSMAHERGRLFEDPVPCDFSEHAANSSAAWMTSLRGKHGSGAIFNLIPG